MEPSPGSCAYHILDHNSGGKVGPKWVHNGRHEPLSEPIYLSGSMPESPKHLSLTMVTLGS